MGSVLHAFVRFLALSSVQFAAVAAVALVALRLARPPGRAALRILMLVAALPLLSPVAERFSGHPLKVLPAAIGARPSPSRNGIAEPKAPAPGGAPAPRDGPGTRPAGAAAAPPRPGPRAVAAPPQPPHDRPLDLRTALGLAWLAGFAIVAVRVVRRGLSLRTLLRTAAPARDPETRALAKECLRQVGPARRPRILVSSACAVPFVAGFRRPRIVVPSRLAGERLRLALLHEMAHVRYRDHLWIVPELLLRTFYFFHPLVRGVLDRLHDEREHRCDRLVTTLSGRRAAYAEFLLDEARRARERPLPVLALRGDRNAVARRVRRILEGGETMRTHTSEHVTVGAVALSLVLVLSCGTATVAVGQEGKPPALDHINASKTDTPGLYHVMPVFEKLTEVTVFKRGGPYGKEHQTVLAPGEGYAFDPATGDLKVTRPIDDEKEMIDVGGVRAMPWAWQGREPFKPGSVRVLLDDREGKQGVDFDVDDAKGRIRFLKPELCDREKPYYITYGFRDDPKQPGVTRGGAIGNHEDQARVRRFLGLPEAPMTKEDASKSVGTNASPTDDPRRWTIVQPMEADGLRVGVAKRNEPGAIRWLESPADYAYDEAATTISFARDIAIDKTTEFLFVSGIPRDRALFFAHRPLREGEVSVTLDGRTLVEGTGFTVDCKAGKITILDKAITAPGAKFRVEATGWVYGN